MMARRPRECCRVGSASPTSGGLGFEAATMADPPMSDQDGGTSEAMRYARAAAAGIAVAFVLLVGNPGTPPSYLLAIGAFAMALVLIVVKD